MRKNSGQLLLSLTTKFFWSVGQRKALSINRELLHWIFWYLAK